MQESNSQPPSNLCERCDGRGFLYIYCNHEVSRQFANQNLTASLLTDHVTCPVCNGTGLKPQHNDKNSHRNG